MTVQKHFKQLVRARMARTGESYTSARRQLLRQSPRSASSKPSSHFPGSVPSAAILRAMLAQAGVRDPERDTPLSEAMVFGIAGGIGAGMFAFHYAEANFSSFYLAGRHLWQDHRAWTEGAAKRLGIRPVVKESGGQKAADQQLRQLLEGGRPVMVWVEGYRVVGVHGIDEAEQVALVSEVADTLRRMPLSQLAATRAKVKGQKNRLLALEPSTKPPQLAQAIGDGLAACVQGLTKARMKNFTLEAFRTWADRLDGSKAADSWEKIFPRGTHFYIGLRSIAEYIEHYGTGGGLCRPLFAEFLGEGAERLSHSGLGRLAERYEGIGAKWSALADAALPESVPGFREARELLTRKAELYHSEGAAAWENSGAEGQGSSPEGQESPCARELGEFALRMKEHFPLDEAQCAALRKELKGRVLELVELERGALEELGRVRI